MFNNHHLLDFFFFCQIAKLKAAFLWVCGKNAFCFLKVTHKHVHSFEFIPVSSRWPRPSFVWWASHLGAMQSSGKATKAAGTALLAFGSRQLFAAGCVRLKDFSTILFLKPSCSCVVCLGAQFVCLFVFWFSFFFSLTFPFRIRLLFVCSALCKPHYRCHLCTISGGLPLVFSFFPVNELWLNYFCRLT